MNIADTIIAKFGGQSALAKLLNKRQSTIQHWSKSGIVPAKWQAPLLALAAERGVSLAPADFVAVPAPETAAEHRVPEAQWVGVLAIGEPGVPCYVLSDGRRVISRTGATGVLTDGKGGGNLESYIEVGALRTYMPTDMSVQMIDFAMKGVVNKTVRGLSAEGFLEICRAYVRAQADGVDLS